MWCLGETVFQALVNRATFDTYGALIQYVFGAVGFPSEALAEVQISDQGIEFVQHLMTPFPLDRPSSEQAIKHTWVVIEDDYKSDASDGNFQGVEEEHAAPTENSQGEITQPDINWTTDLDTADLDIVSRIQAGPGEQDSQNISQRSHSPCEEALTDTVPAINPERRFVLVNSRKKDENRIGVSQAPTDSLFYRSSSNSTQASLDCGSEGMEEKPAQLGHTVVSTPAEEELESSQSENERESEIDARSMIQSRIHIGRKTKTRGHSVWGKFLSKRVLTELGCKYQIIVKVGDLFDLALAETLITLTHIGKPHNFS